MTERQLCYDNFIPVLLREIPELQTTYEEHIKYYNELLPHVLMGDATRFLIELYRSGTSSRRYSRDSLSVVKAMLRLFEQAMESSDVNLQELMCVSFLENLWQAKNSYLGIKGLLGPHLREQLRLYEMGDNKEGER